MIDMSVPESTVAAVLLSHEPDGELMARYVEASSRVPAPRRQVADALLRLAVKLTDQADDLEP